MEKTLETYEETRDMTPEELKDYPHLRYGTDFEIRIGKGRVELIFETVETQITTPQRMR